jgi:hypothetical protein
VVWCQELHFWIHLQSPQLEHRVLSWCTIELLDYKIQNEKDDKHSVTNVQLNLYQPHHQCKCIDLLAIVFCTRDDIFF